MAAAKTANERKANERKRMRAAGFVLRQVWVHGDDVARFAKYVEWLRKRRTQRNITPTPPPPHP